MLTSNVYVERRPALNILWICFYVVALHFVVDRLFFTRGIFWEKFVFMVCTCAAKCLLMPGHQHHSDLRGVDCCAIQTHVIWKDLVASLTSRETK